MYTKTEVFDKNLPPLGQSVYIVKCILKWKDSLVFCLSLLPLKILYYSDACGIEVGDKIILTGVHDPADLNTRLDRVTSYDIFGNHEDYPPLLETRTDHGCGYYRNSAQKLVRINKHD